MAAMGDRSASVGRGGGRGISPSIAVMVGNNLSGRMPLGVG